MSPSDPKLHQIGEVAERVGLSLRTVRYYEEMGLISPAQRTEGGFRLYSDAEIERLQLIKHMKPLGFTVQAMLELLQARDTLHGSQANDTAKQQAITTLGRFAAEAGERVDELHAQLDRAEDFAGQLSRELRRHRRALRASAR
jgi:DNA-binding transcriptional MerR regulator